MKTIEFTPSYESKAFFRYALCILFCLKDIFEEIWFELEDKNYENNPMLSDCWKHWFSKEDWNKATPTKLLFKLGKYVDKKVLDDLYGKIISLSMRRNIDPNNALGYLFNEFVSIPSLSKAKNYGLQKDIITKVDMFFINFLALPGIKKFSIQSIEWMDFSIIKELKELGEVWGEESMDPLYNDFAIYYGMSLIKHYEGYWIQDSNYISLVRINDQLIINPYEVIDSKIMKMDEPGGLINQFKKIGNLKNTYL
jgi:hypothetical protein